MLRQWGQAWLVRLVQQEEPWTTAAADAACVAVWIVTADIGRFAPLEIRNSQRMFSQKHCCKGETWPLMLASWQRGSPTHRCLWALTVAAGGAGHILAGIPQGGHHRREAGPVHCERGAQGARAGPPCRAVCCAGCQGTLRHPIADSRVPAQRPAPFWAGTAEMNAGDTVPCGRSTVTAPGFRPWVQMLLDSSMLWLQS